MRTKKFNIHKTIVLSLLLSLILLVLSSISVHGATVEPVVYSGNPNCKDLGYTSGFKIDTNPTGGTYTFENGTQNGDPTVITIGLQDPNNSVTITTNGSNALVSWTSTIGIDAVIMKGGNAGANVYTYDPEVQTDSNLVTPSSSNNPTPNISHIEFCYDYEVTVYKTAVATFDRQYDWTILKTVNPAHWNLFTGDTATSTFTVTPTRDAGTDVNFTVTGLITVFNDTPFTATITDIVDTLNVATTGGGLTDCNFDDDVVIAAGDTLYCNYSFSLDGKFNGTNTAVVSTSGSVGGGTATADFTFGTEPANEIDETATISDPQDPLGVRNANSGVSYNYDVTYNCDNVGDNVNTATLTEGDTWVDRTDDATVTIACYDLEVSKTAVTAIDLTYNWQITKDVDIPSWALFNGENATSTYTVQVSQNGEPTPSGWQVSGEITVTNPAPIDAILSNIADTVNPGGLDVTVDCSATTYPIVGAGQSIVCTYVKSLPSALTGTNTATATNQNYNRPAGTAAGTTDYSSLEVPFDFSNPAIDEEFNKTVNVTDTFDTLSAVEIASLTADQNDDSSVTYPETGDTWVYTRTFTCGTDHLYENTATLLGDNDAVLDSDSESVDVTCYTPSIRKDAETTFERYWFWDLDKESPETGDNSPYDDLTDADFGDLLLQTNHSYGINYVLYLSATSTDDDHAVSGKVYIYNPHPTREMNIATVTDALSNGLTPLVDCGGATSVASLATLECSYSADLDDATSLSNTATVVQNLFTFDANGSSFLGTIDYTSEAVDVTFDNTPDNEHNECVTVSDIQSIDLGTGTPITLPDSEVCANDLDANGRISISYTVNVEFAECGLHQVENTATITPNDGGTPAEDTVTIYVNIDCFLGCTRTIGYWKTHSIYGPAPYDETWDGLEDAPFFNSGYTYYEILWEPVRGRGYIQLAKQYIGARLNELAGTDVPPDVADALAAADAFFNSANANTVETLRGRDARTVRDLASLLDDYNNGLLGPLHCDEDSSSSDND